MLNQGFTVVTGTLSRNQIDSLIWRARQERNAELVRLISAAYGATRDALRRALTRASAAIRSHAMHGNARHA